MLFVLIIEQKIVCNQTVDIAMVYLIGIKISLIPDDAWDIVGIKMHKTYISSSISSLLAFVVHALISSLLLNVHVVKRHKKMLISCFCPKEYGRFFCNAL